MPCNSDVFLLCYNKNIFRTNIWPNYHVVCFLFFFLFIYGVFEMFHPAQILIWSTVDRSSLKKYAFKEYHNDFANLISGHIVGDNKGHPYIIPLVVVALNNSNRHTPGIIEIRLNSFLNFRIVMQTRLKVAMCLLNSPLIGNWLDENENTHVRQV